MKLTCGHCGEELKLVHGAIHECETLEDRESTVYATGYWNGIAAKKLREISDEEILALWVKKNNLNGAKDILDFARAIESYLKGEKFCNKCNNTRWVCEWHPDKEAHKCCGGAGMPCECNKESEREINL